MRQQRFLRKLSNIPKSLIKVSLNTQFRFIASRVRTMSLTLNGRLLLHDDEHFKTWKGHFTTVLNRITFGQVPPFVDETASHRKMSKRTIPPSRRGTIFSIKALKRGKAAGLDSLATPVISVDILLPLVQKFLESETLPRGWIKGTIGSIPK